MHKVHLTWVSACLQSDMHAWIDGWMEGCSYVYTCVVCFVGLYDFDSLAGGLAGGMLID